MRGPVQSVDVSFFVHATEDSGRVEAKVAQSLGLEGPPEVEKLEGHFGNPIESVSFHATGELALRAYRRLVEGFPESLRRRLADEISMHVDEHQSLYIRLDKQALMEGRFALGSSDTVRVKVKPRLYSLGGGAINFYREALKDG